MHPEELITLLQATPEPKPVFYRLYHDSEGNPIFYSMEDVPGHYIDIDRDTYAKNSMRVKVINGKLIEVSWKTTAKLVPGEVGTPCDPRDVAVVVDFDTNTKWSKHTYESY